MSAVDLEEIQVTDWDETTPPVLIHLFPKDPKYRKSGNRAQVQPGDIARCGVVKVNLSPNHPKGSANCAVCIAIRDALR